jgi:glycosyl-4,4'-diaponeurosporenoate acyltransferase
MEVRGLMPLVSSAAFWLLASVLVGLLANQLPERWLGAGSPRATLSAPASPWGGSSRQPGLLHIRGWKRWIPDAGGALPGGVRKASLVQRDPAALRRLLLETRRAEIVHWLLWPAALLTALWLPPAGVMVNLAFASLFNLPCVLVQRYNRGRLQRCLARMLC